MEARVPNSGVRSARRNLKFHAQSYNFRFCAGMQVQVSFGAVSVAAGGRSVHLHTATPSRHKTIVKGSGPVTMMEDTVTSSGISSATRNLKLHAQS